MNTEDLNDELMAGERKCTTFKYKIEKDEQGNITNFVVEKVGETKKKTFDDTCAKPGFAYIERDGKPFTL